MASDVEVEPREAEGNIVSLTAAKSLVESRRAEGKCEEVLIHVRFSPNGLVNTIDKCPEKLSAQDWFYHLCYAAPRHYQVFAGGRGVFRMQRSYFEAILSQNPS